LWWRAKRELGLLYGRLGDRAHEAEVLGEIEAIWANHGDSEARREAVLTG
jgi:hypothetical protein